VGKRNGERETGKEKVAKRKWQRGSEIETVGKRKWERESGNWEQGSLSKNLF
jgi:hypothetical protein